MASMNAFIQLIYSCINVVVIPPIENVSIDNECDLEYEFWDFDYCASVLRNPGCSTRPGKLVCDDFTLKGHNGK